MDKLKVTNHINDVDLKNKMFKIVDICNSVLKNHEEKHSEFLNPFEVKNAVSIINSNDDIEYSIDGGYDNAERAIINIFPYYTQKEDIEPSTSILEISGNFKFSSISHRDYLGSLLGLGLKREKIGDILVGDNNCHIIVDKDISDFIIFNLKKVGKNSIRIKEIERTEIIIPEQEYEEISTTVSSLRLDNIVSQAYNISRSKVVNIIESGYVQVNYEKIIRSSYTVDEGSKISVRTKGKFILSEIGCTTRKDKIRIKIKKYK